MQAGRLLQIVTIERPVERKDSSGAIVVDRWEAFAENVWASIEPLRARELFEAAHIQAQTDTLIRIRFRPGVNVKMRVVHVTERMSSPQLVHVYDIEGVVHVRERRREMHLMCKRRASEGFRTHGQ